MANRITIKETQFCVGDIVRVIQNIKEKDKEKTQVFEGRVISISGRAPNKSFIVRRMGIDNIGVEKIFPVESPTITKVEIKKHIPVRRAKLFYIRGDRG